MRWGGIYSCPGLEGQEQGTCKLGISKVDYEDYETA